MASLTVGSSGTRNHPFAGIIARLQRVDENIVNLTGEIIRFFQASEYPVIPNPNVNREEWQKAVNYHKALYLPPRFSVLTGEVVHHLRSCLDHLVWIFSSEEARQEHESALGFPIIADKAKLSRMERQIQGITNPRIRKLIEDLQPCLLGDDAANDPLCIIHDMDRFDKHRELVIVTACANLVFPDASPELIAKIMAYKNAKSTMNSDDAAIALRAIKNDAKVFPEIAFAKFGKREGQFVSPGLALLLNATRGVVDIFSREL